MRLAARISLFALAAAAGCGGSSTAPSSSGSTVQQQPQGGGNTGGSTSSSITVSNNFFDPASTTVTAGTEVTWTWNACTGDGYGGQTCASHGVTFDDGSSSATQSAGTWTRRFTTPGTFTYHCPVHGSAMSGTIVVK